MNPPTGQRNRQNARRLNRSEAATAVRTKPPSMSAVTTGVVRMTAENSATARNATFCGQMFRSGAGHSIPRVSAAHGERRRIARRWAHSPTTGSGQAMHHARAPRGMRSRMSSAHQTIQTKMIAKFRFPTGVPRIPAAMISEKNAAFTMTARGCRPRHRSSRRTGAQRVSSMRPSLGSKRIGRAATAIRASPRAGAPTRHTPQRRSPRPRPRPSRTGRSARRRAGRS